MSRFPGQKGLKGKGRNRQNREKNEQANGDSSTFQNEGHSNFSTVGQPAAGDGNANSGKDDGQSIAASSRNDPKKTHFNKRSEKHGGSRNGLGRSALTSNSDPVRENAGIDVVASERVQGEPVSVSGVDGAQPKRRRNRRKNGRFNSGGDQMQRHLRQPVKPAPNVAYSPKQDDGIEAQPNVSKEGQGNFKKPRHAQPKRRDQNLFAALDLGTNNCRLLVAVPQEKGRFRVIDGFSRIVRLGEGLAHSGKLSDDAMDRAVQALKICAEKMISHDIKRHRLIATEACRQASNGEEFLKRVKQETGMDLEIIDRQTEAYLAAEGCGALMDRKADAAVLFDIGGGSSELVLVNRQGRKKRIADQIVSWTSVPIGVVTLAERHGGKTVNKEVFQAMISEVREFLDRFEGRDELARIWKNGRVHLLGTSGTVTTLAGIHLGLPKYERRLVDGLWLSANEIDKVIQDLLAMDYKQRASSPCIGNERADLVMAGCAILEAIRQTWPSNRLRVADRGLREGILTQLMDREAAWLPSKSGRWRRPNQFRGNRNRNSGPSEQTKRN